MAQREMIERIEKIALAVAFIAATTAIVAKSSESHWTKLVSPDGSFAVLMPDKPKQETGAISGLAGKFHSFSAWNRTKAQFTFTYADRPLLPQVATGESFLDAQRQVLTQGDPKRLLSAERLIVNGYPARQYKAITEDGSEGDERVYLVKHRLYILLVVHDRNGDEADVKKFFDSFTFEPRD